MEKINQYLKKSSLKPELQERYEKNMDLLNMVVDFCVENNLKVIDVSEVCVIIFKITCTDEKWIELRDKLKSDPRFFQQPKGHDGNPEIYDSQIRVRKDIAGNCLARVSIEYTWKKAEDYKLGYPETMELSVLRGRAFAGHKEYNARVVELLKKIYPDADKLDYTAW